MKISAIDKQTAEKALSNDRVFSSIIKTNDLFFEKIINFSRTRNHYPDHLEKEDLKQELYISFVKALRKFKGDRNCSFSTFAWTVLQNDLKALKHREFKIKINETKAIDFFPKETLKTEIQLLDIASSLNKNKYDLEKEIVGRITFEEALSKITSINRKIMEFKISGLKMKQIAEKLKMNLNTLKWIYTTSTLPQYKKALKDSIIL